MRFIKAIPKGNDEVLGTSSERLTNCILCDGVIITTANNWPPLHLWNHFDSEHPNIDKGWCDRTHYEIENDEPAYILVRSEQPSGYCSLHQSTSDKRVMVNQEEYTVWYDNRSGSVNTEF